jgi:hypothetical protein
MTDSFTETTSESWFSRLIGSIKSVLVGILLFLGSFPVLFVNEGHAVGTARTLEEGAGIVVSVPSAAVDPKNEGRLVHMTGEATTTETLVDPEFGVKANALKLVRDVEMYQWKEEKKTEERKKLGGGSETVTTYDYRKTWSETRVDSSTFKKMEGHENPPQFPVEADTQLASSVTVGAFHLSPAMVGQLDRSEDISLGENAGTLPDAMKGRVTRAGTGYYMGAAPASPAVGDVRITFKAVRPAVVSLVARQVGPSFEAYHTKAGGNVLLLKYGTLDAAAMFKAAQQEATILTWIFRFVGFLLMFLGLVMIFRPITVFADVIPLLGTLLGAGIGLFAGLTALVLSLVTIAVSWLFFRPLLAIVLLGIAVGGLFLLVRVGLKRRQMRRTTPMQGAA